MQPIRLEIPVSIKQNPYNIVIGGQGLDGIAAELKIGGITSGTKILVVTNHDVAKSYAENFIDKLKENDYLTSLAILESGEANKNIKGIDHIHNDTKYLELVK